MKILAYRVICVEKSRFYPQYLIKKKWRYFYNNNSWGSCIKWFYSLVQAINFIEDYQSNDKIVYYKSVLLPKGKGELSITEGDNNG